MVLDEQTENYRLVIEETGTKLDTQGVIQCSNYAEVIEHTDSLHIYGYRLKTLIAYLTQTDEQYIVVKKRGFQNISINILYQNKSSTHSIDKVLILQKLKLLYHFQVMIDSASKTAYELVVSDTAKLRKYAVPCMYSGTIQSTSNQLDVTGQKIGLITRTFNDIVGEHIYTRVADSSACYTFTIKFSSFEDLGQKLNGNYGLTLTETTLNTPILSIEDN